MRLFRFLGVYDFPRPSRKRLASPKRFFFAAAGSAVILLRLAFLSLGGGLLSLGEGSSSLVSPTLGRGRRPPCHGGEDRHL